MKIYSRPEFMKLPAGTIFSSGNPYSFMGLYVKGLTWEVDFLQSSLIDIDSFSSEQNADRMYEMYDNETSYPINHSFGREGSFDDTMVYLVYEKEDLKYLIDMFNKYLKRQND